MFDDNSDQPDHFDIWDEHRWERHIDDAERKSEELRRYLESALGKEPPRWLRLLDEPATGDVVDQFIEEELMFEEAYFPDDDDDWDDEDDEDEIFMSMDDDDDDADDGEDAAGSDGPAYELMDELEGEEWKRAMADDSLDDGDIQKWDIYTRAHDLALDVFEFAKANPMANTEPAFVEMGSNLLTMSAKLAGGYSFGFDMDNIGANIVYCRKALQSANRTLDLLQAQRGKEHLAEFPYVDIHGELFELRNDIGVHIQELRDRFNSGV